MSRSIKNSILLTIFVIYIILYKLFIFNNFMKYSGLINASFLLLLLGLSIKFLGFRKNKPNVMSSNIMKNVIFYLIITFVLMYALGAVVGFLNNAYSRVLPVMFDNVFAPIFIILFTELFRYVVISANKDKKLVIVLLTLLLIIFENLLFIKGIKFDLESLFKLFALTVVPIIIKNSVLSYICFHIGYQVPLLYRLVMDVYIFIVPIIPDLGDYLNSVILITVPIIIYITSFNEIDKKIHKPEPMLIDNSFSILDVPIVMFLIIIIALVSGLFPYYMIGVGSQSMMPKINKGDTVIIKKLTDSTVLKRNDVIAFKKDGVTVVHRIVEINKDKNGVRYTTKGDANNANDSNKVERKQVVGIVEARVPFIAYPTIWLREMFTNN